MAVEEPLQIRLRSWAGESRDLSVTMRTPGDDFDLVAGFLVGEGIVRAAEDLATMRYCAGTDEAGEQTFNVIDATLAAGVALPPSRAERQVTTTSACGICGTTSISDVVRAAPAWPPDDTVVSLDVLLGLPERLREQQSVFERTGGVHAAGHRLKVAPPDWTDRWRRVLQVSGRASFELVQTARQGGIPILAAVGAPSSLAVDLAEEADLTLVGFSRGSSLNVYTHAHRVSG